MNNMHARDSCNLANGDLYIYPNTSSQIDATQPLTFKWNTACSLSSSVDLYLYEPSSATGLIHAWVGVNYADGQYTANLLPKWWNDTTTAQLQLSIINSGAASWDTSSPAGPVFTVDYAQSAMVSVVNVGGASKTTTLAAAVTQSQDAVFQDVSSTGDQHKGISKGGIAAAVIVPLLVLVIIGAVATRFWRQREAEKLKRWSQALSSNSNLEWEKGALPGEKPQSILGRPSTTFSQRPMSQFATSRPTTSMFAVENNFAGTGAGGTIFPPPSLGSNNGSRTSIVLPSGEVRQSRISFAETARPDRRSRMSVASNSPAGIFRMQGASKFSTEVGTPVRKGVTIDDEELNISPSQAHGPHGFGDAEMRKVSGGRRTGKRSIIGLGGDKSRESSASALSQDDFKSAASARGSVDELRDLEAVMLMRRSILSQYSASRSTPTFDTDGVPNPSLPSQFSNPPTPDVNNVESLVPPVPNLPQMPPPTAGSTTVAYGPDQMLAVYAARGKVSGSSSPLPSTGFGNVPSPKPSSRQSAGIRILDRFGKRGDKEDRESMPLPPIPSGPGGMKSMVHLNTGSVSATAVHGLTTPSNNGARGSQVSEGSIYDEEIGEAK